MLDNKGFDLWAKDYDKSVEKSSNEYPFDGYYEVLSYVYNSVDEKKSKNILDIGFGTGALTNKLYQDGGNVFGMDFSQNMIDIAKEKMPNGVFVKQDFNLGVAKEFQNIKFDYIISSYAIHHLDNDKKVEFIGELKNLLKEDGKIIIADVAFETEDILNKCKYENIDKWDEDEIYMVEENIVPALGKSGISVVYKQLSSCAGVLEIR